MVVEVRGRCPWASSATRSVCLGGPPSPALGRTPRRRALADKPAANGSPLLAFAGLWDRWKHPLAGDLRLCAGIN